MLLDEGSAFIHRLWWQARDEAIAQGVPVLEAKRTQFLQHQRK